MKKLSIIFIFLTSMVFTKPGYHEPWGKDKELCSCSKTEEEINQNIPSKMANSIISFYQNVISPTNAPKSAFRPTSSRYMQLAIKRYGFIKGYLMGCDRLIRENDDKWVYRTIEIDNKKYKFDPAVTEKYSR